MKRCKKSTDKFWNWSPYAVLEPKTPILGTIGGLTIPQRSTHRFLPLLNLEDFPGAGRVDGQSGMENCNACAEAAYFTLSTTTV